ncbi:hypothetical protein [Thermomonospora umbrina]|uniref:Uncharacterized protein n=1 Tax=Thermomonospora umbrina TaxID=111806 RepID=A0A3D9SVQ2_9ACTN|nr:hypothetical protein [Thermomonospora umbrina]REE98580.1 hypothetical protein DFJ69_4072 [Thermomonospora umbrina]
MRRIGAVALTTTALVAGLGALAAPAQAQAPAAPSKGKWTTPDAYAANAAWGRFVRTRDKVTIEGRLRDESKDGRTACVRFKATEKGARAHFLKAAIVVKDGGGPQTYYDGKATVRIATASTNTTHLYVQECVRDAKKGAWEYAEKWRRLY